MKILVLNSGSSSQKACLYEIGETLPDRPPTCLWEGRIEFDGDAATIAAKNSDGAVFKEQIPISSREEVVRHLLRTLRDGKARAIGSVTEIEAVAPCCPWGSGFRGSRDCDARGAGGYVERVSTRPTPYPG